jgi:hypothetical protein
VKAVEKLRHEGPLHFRDIKDNGTPGLYLRILAKPALSFRESRHRGRAPDEECFCRRLPARHCHAPGCGQSFFDRTIDGTIASIQTNIVDAYIFPETVLGYWRDLSRMAE